MLLFILFITIVYTQIPECTYQCDDPQCPAVCEPVCEPVNCEILCDPVDTPGVCNPVNCQSDCATDGDILNSCPMCEVTCDPLRCQPIDRPCVIQCQAIQCSWKCVKPTTCPYPRCELQCQLPACEFSQSGKITISLFLILLNKLLFIC